MNNSKSQAKPRIIQNSKLLILSGSPERKSPKECS